MLHCRRISCSFNRTLVIEKLKLGHERLAEVWLHLIQSFLLWQAKNLTRLISWIEVVLDVGPAQHLRGIRILEDILRHLTTRAVAKIDRFVSSADPLPIARRIVSVCLFHAWIQNKGLCLTVLLPCGHYFSLQRAATVVRFDQGG